LDPGRVEYRVGAICDRHHDVCTAHCRLGRGSCDSTDLGGEPIPAFGCAAEHAEFRDVQRALKRRHLGASLPASTAHRHGLGAGVGAATAGAAAVRNGPSWSASIIAIGTPSRSYSTTRNRAFPPPTVYDFSPDTPPAGQLANMTLSTPPGGNTRRRGWFCASPLPRSVVAASAALPTPPTRRAPPRAPQPPPRHGDTRARA